VAYEEGRPVGIHTLLISTQHTPTIGAITEEAAVQERIRADLWEAVVTPVFAELPIKPDSHTRFLTNPTGKFVIGGPQGDAGLTGRKIIVDTYGGYSRHGGGAFSGQGSHQGGSQRCLCGSLRGQEHRGGWLGAKM